MRTPRHRYFDPLAAVVLLLLLLVGMAAGSLAVAPTSSLIVIIGLIGVAGLAVCFAQPQWGFLFLVFATYINLSDVLTVYHAAIPIEKYLLLFLFLAVAIRSALNRESPFRDWTAQTRSAVLALIAYGTLTATSVLYAEDHTAALDVATDNLKNATFAILVLLLVRDGRTLRAAVWMMLCAGIFLGAITSYQHFSESYYSTFGGFGRAWGVENLDDPNHAQRLTGPIGDPNFFGQILVVLVVLAWDRICSERRPALRLIAACCLGLVLISIVATFSRGTFLSLLIVSCAMLVRYRLRPAVVVSCVLVGLLMIPLLPASYTERLVSAVSFVPGFEDNTRESDPAVVGRLDELAAGIYMFLDNPVLGVGAGNYQTHFRRYTQRMNLTPRYEARKSHSYYIELAAERGIVGLSAFAALMFLVLRGLLRARRELSQTGLKDHSHLAATMGICLLGYASSSVLLHDDFSRYLWLLIGLALSLPQIASNEIRGLAGMPAQPPESRANNGVWEITREPR